MPEKTVNLAPEKPRVFCCPDCMLNGDPYKMKFRVSASEQWGTVVTRHDYYRCPHCGETYVSTNGRRPELAAHKVR